MKKQRNIFGILLLVFLFIGCSKNEESEDASACENVTCLNGGECIDGTCDCPPGYSGADCGEFVPGSGGGGDECDGVNCENGGFCVDGTCICPQGYEGDECQNQVTPALIRITKIKISDIPDKDFGGWDFNDGSGPDLYVQIEYANGDLIYRSDVIYNADILANYTFDLQSDPIEITNVETNHIFRVLDEDLGAEDDQLRGVNTGSLYTPYNEFPKTYVVFYDPDLTLTLEYEW